MQPHPERDERRETRDGEKKNRITHEISGTVWKDPFARLFLARVDLEQSPWSAANLDYAVSLDLCIARTLRGLLLMKVELVGFTDPTLLPHMRQGPH